MKDFFKYLTAGESDKQWGMYLNVAGRAKIDPLSAYPSTDHPTGYHYKWEDGRVLEEFQINYVSQGYGTLENKQGIYSVKPGTVMIIRPGVWHRYRPDPKTGWVENYLGFEGKIASHFLAQSVLSSDKPIINFGFREELIDTYFKIYHLVLEEAPGFQQIASGLVIKLLGYIVAYKKQQNFSGKHIERVIQKARFYMHQNMAHEIDLKNMAMEHQVGYSYFRKMFKKYTGVAPHHYHLELKVLRARELILTTDRSIKEIGYELGFSSIYYFSRFFKNKIGVSPMEFKKASSRKPLENNS